MKRERETRAVVHNWNGDHTRAEREISSFAERGVKVIKHTGMYGAVPDDYGRDWFLERIEHLCSRYHVFIWIEPDGRLICIPESITHQFLDSANY